MTSKMGYGKMKNQIKKMKPTAGGKPKAVGKRKRISADKVNGPINLGGANVGKKGVVGTVGGKDVVGSKKKKPPKSGIVPIGKGLGKAAGKRRKNKPNDPKLFRG